MLNLETDLYVKPNFYRLRAILFITKRVLHTARHQDIIESAPTIRFLTKDAMT